MKNNNSFEFKCDDNKYRYVYLINNRVNGNTYVGQHTTENLEDGYFGSGKLLKRAIKKYGKEKFEKGYLAFTNNIDELNNSERFWVKFFKDHKRGCYNIANGGQNIFTPEICNKISETRKRKLESGEIVPWNKGKTGVYSKETLKKFSEVQKGKTQSKESNEKRSKTLKGRKISQETIDKRLKTIKDNPKIYSQEDKSRISNQMKEFNKNNKLICPWCNKVCTVINAKNWHFDNCKENPNYSLKNEIKCPYCGKSSRNKAMMKRWHFDNCKYKNDGK